MNLKKGLNYSDTGGYTSLIYLGLGYDREAELLKRWAEMNAFSAVPYVIGWLSLVDQKSIRSEL